MKFFSKKKQAEALEETVGDDLSVHPEDLSDQPPFEDVEGGKLAGEEPVIDVPKGFMTRILSRVKKTKSKQGDSETLETVKELSLSLDRNAKKEPSGSKLDGLKEKINALLGKGSAKKGPAERATRDGSGLAEIETGNAPDYEFDNYQTLKIGKKNVVLNMLWDSTRPSESIKTQAKAVSSEEAYYSLAANFRDANQLGFSDGSNAIKPGFKAGVTCFNPEQMGDSWVAAFRIGENADIWWIVALRNGQVYEDQLLRDEDEARMLFLENMQAPDWQRRIAPDYWEIGGTEDYRIQDALAPSFGIALKPVNPVKTYLPRLIVAGVLVVVGIVAHSMYQSHLETQAEQERLLEQQRDASVRISPSDYPWFDSPSVLGFINDCTPVIEGAMRFIPGWRQDVISCTFHADKKAARVATSWTNVGGTVPWLTANFDPNEPPPNIDANGTSATYGNSILFDVKTEVLPEPWEGARIESVLRRRLQTTGAKVELTASVQRITPEQRVKLREPVFNFHQVSFQTSGAIEDYLRLFSDIPARVPVDAVYNIKSRVWNISFRIYHPAVLPM
ncbi:type 4b pilus protein PilO2 [Sulfitobacter sp. 1A13353]|uniref:type 4b pilus protein PilO2 n=1 Tax=Sulfitobacter sp. 1A13353 TaxID=3368568 RepID=UPI0037467965